MNRYSLRAMDSDEDTMGTMSSLRSHEVCSLPHDGFWWWTHRNCELVNTCVAVVSRVTVLFQFFHLLNTSSKVL